MNKQIISILAAFISLAIGAVAVFLVNSSTVETSSPTIEQTIDDQNQINQPIRALKAERPESIEKSIIGKRLYKGYWFDIEYPENFIPSPTDPINYHEGIRMILTDQAYFSSPDGRVEFYVYSPLWAGYPEYLDMLSTEELISKETTERDTTVSESNLSKQNRVTFITYREKNNLYYRSIAFYEQNLYEGEDLPETSHVFGIKYQDQASYDQYQTAYTEFKASLQQYAD